MCEIIEKFGERMMAKGLAKGLAKGSAKGLAKGLSKGLAEGESKGRLDTLVELVRDGMLDVRNAAQKSGMPLEAFQKLVAATA